MGSTFLIVCLGNPGQKYENTRHNIGFRIGDSLAKSLSLDQVGSKFKSTYFKGTFQSSITNIHLIKPLTYMNLSGEAVIAAANYYKVEPSNIIVVYDDYDIELGTIRLRMKGSGGTHNGMKSIIQHVGNNLFPRLRIGIGPKPSFMDTSRFVLSNFSNSEEDILKDVISQSVDAIKSVLSDGIEKAMNKVNTKPKSIQ
ncbi:aminoacyl-tRNA hydrolase [bacterium]|nr:aminoacyl-tRNA hydrolase [bacterium]